jgi:hypothetical protein
MQHHCCSQWLYITFFTHTSLRTFSIVTTANKTLKALKAQRFGKKLLPKPCVFNVLFAVVAMEKVPREVCEERN